MKIDQTTIDNIKGFLDPEEGRGLYDIALDASRMGPCLEIGSYCGKSAVYLGSACQGKRGRPVFHRPSPGIRGAAARRGVLRPRPVRLYSHLCHEYPAACFVETLALAGLEETVVPIVSRSDVAARNWETKLSLVFIDGGHAFETARTDYGCWADHLLPGGYLLIHDIFENPEEGGQAPWEVYKIAVASGRFEELPRIKTLGVLKRKVRFTALTVRQALKGFRHSSTLI